MFSQQPTELDGEARLEKKKRMSPDADYKLAALPLIVAVITVFRIQ